MEISRSLGGEPKTGEVASGMIGALEVFAVQSVVISFASAGLTEGSNC